MGRAGADSCEGDADALQTLSRGWGSCRDLRCSSQTLRAAWASGHGSSRDISRMPVRLAAEGMSAASPFLHNGSVPNLHGRAALPPEVDGWPAQLSFGQLTLIRRGIAFSAFGSTSVITPSFSSALIPSCSILLEI